MENLYAIATVWVITWRFVWPIVIVLGVFGLLAAGTAALPAWRSQLPPPWLFLAMLIAPLASIVWSGAFWAAEQSLPPSANHWRSITHNTISVLGVVTALGLAFWFRKVHRAWLIFVCAVFVILFTLAAWFVGAMAISNVWL